MTVRITETFDTSDLPAVTSAEMWIAMRLAVDMGRGLVLWRGATDADRTAIEAAFWQAWRGTTERGVVVLLRFWHLAAACRGRRVRARLLNDGFAGLAPALAAAAVLRLNHDRGFAPQRLLWAMAAHRDTAGIAPTRTRPVAELARAA